MAHLEAHPDFGALKHNQDFLKALGKMLDTVVFPYMAPRSPEFEAAQLVLGHAKADVTQIYAEADHAKARQIALERG